MNSQKMGELISSVRKSKNMTQKELADQLSVTDKAVSKWERGIGYPDITILPSLSDALGVTMSDLLNGEITAEKAEQETGTDEIISNTLKYAGEVQRHRKFKSSNLAISILTIVFLIAVFICILCNFVSSGKIDWALYPTGALAFVWFIIVPLIYFKKHKYIISLLMVSVLLIPFLYLIELLGSSNNWMIPLGIPVSFISLVYLWIAVPLFAYTKINRWYLSAAVILLGVGLDCGIEYYVQRFVQQPGTDIYNVFSNICVVIIAIILFFIGLARKKKQLEAA